MLTRKEAQQFYTESLSHCTLCPRNCGVNRLAGETGFCGQTAKLFLARAALHFWEEPCISGTVGSGTVFFTGCNMQCVFCQNHSIALSNQGKEISIERLSQIFLELQGQGAANINLVTPSHAVPQLLLALLQAKENGLTLPIVYNTSSYEKRETLQMLEGLVDIYLPDLKFFSPENSARFSKAPNYFEVATEAISEMVRQVGNVSIDPETGMMTKGVIVRHLCLPNQIGESKRILRYLHNTYRNQILISILNQYTPMPQLKEMTHMSDIDRAVTVEEYDRVRRFACAIGIEGGYFQEGAAQGESFIPDFTFQGL